MRLPGGTADAMRSLIQSQSLLGHLLWKSQSCLLSNTFCTFARGIFVEHKSNYIILLLKTLWCFPSDLGQGSYKLLPRACDLPSSPVSISPPPLPPTSLSRMVYPVQPRTIYAGESKISIPALFYRNIMHATCLTFSSR